MHRLHFKPYIFSLNAALSALEKVGAWRPALRLLRRFEEWRVTATETTCSAVVSVPWRDGLGLRYIYIWYIWYIYMIYIYIIYIWYIYIHMYIVEYVCNQYIQYNMYRVPCCYPPHRLPIHMLFAALWSPILPLLRSPNSCVLHTTYHKPIFAIYTIYCTIYTVYCSLCTIYASHIYIYAISYICAIYKIHTKYTHTHIYICTHTYYIVQYIHYLHYLQYILS